MDVFAGMEAFVAVVERGGFTAAGASLQTAKSSVSEAVRALEERMGVRLLERTTRSVRPTEAGVAFYRHCRRLMDGAAVARDEAQAAHRLPAGRLRIAVPDAFAGRYIVPGLPVFFAAYPTIEVELTAGAEAVRLINEGVDLAIRIAEKPAPGLVVRRIATSRILIVASPGYLAAAGVPEKPGDIRVHKLAGYAPLAWRDRWQLGSETVDVRPRILINEGEALRAAALAGLGLVAVPEWLVADALVAGQLVSVLDAHAPPSSGLYAVYPTNRLLTSRVRVFVDHLVRDLRARGLPR